MLRILAVDDDPEILTQLKVFLKDQPYELICFSTPQEAISYIQSKPPLDLILADVNMPEMDGFTLAKKIHEELLEKQPPIFFLTAANTLEHVKQATLVGAQGYIIKPISKHSIIEKIDKFFNARTRISDNRKLKQLSKESLLQITLPLSIVSLDEKSIVFETTEALPQRATFEFKSTQLKSAEIDNLSLVFKNQTLIKEKNLWRYEFKISGLEPKKIEQFKTLLRLWNFK